jgi:hypothetical protein
MCSDPGIALRRVAVGPLTFHVAIKQFESLGTAGIARVGLQEPL